MTKKSLKIGIFIIFIIFHSILLAETIVKHLGANNPVNEAPYEWVFAVGPNNGSLDVGPILNDIGGYDAWKTNDDQTSTSGGGYKASLSADESTRARTNGWVLRTRLRVVDVPDSLDGAVKLDFSDSNRTWRLVFGTTNTGDPIIAVGDGITNPSYTVTGAGNSYNLYELVYDPSTQSANLFVNGKKVITGYNGLVDTIAPNVNFGSGSTQDTGQGNWNFIELEITTEIDNIIVFFEKSVSTGLIYGVGSGRSASGRLNALRKKLLVAKDLIDNDLTEDACIQINDILKKVDGVQAPPDFAGGPNVYILYDKLIVLRSNLSCN